MLYRLADASAAKNLKYTTLPLKSSPNNIRGKSLLRAQSFHFLATPEEILYQIPELLSLRDQGGAMARPLLVWEPFPAACQLENLDIMLQACKLVDLFSPNHLDVARLFTRDAPEKFQPEQLAQYARNVIDASIGQPGSGYVVRRAAEHGCLVGSRSETLSWLPAFYPSGSPKDVDPTGPGNAFLGGLTIGLQKSLPLIEAASYGKSAASFALEQIGLPTLRLSNDDEKWNDDNALWRLEIYRSRFSQERVT